MERAKQFFTELCFVYTLVSVIGAVVNMIAGTQTNNMNVLVMFATCAIAAFVLYLHRLFDNVSPLVMIIVQYLAACTLVGLMLFLIGTFVEPISARGWFEYFRSFTIPYVILASLYYWRVFSETRKQDALLKEIQAEAEK